MCSPVIPARAGMTVRCCQNQDLRDLWDGRMGQSKDPASGSVAVGPRSPIGYNGDFDGFDFNENRDLGRYVFERVLG